MKKIFLPIICFLVLLTIFTTGALGADVCVDSASTLQTALNTAESSGESDVIRVVQGTYTDNFSYSSGETHSLTLLGGCIAGCASRDVNPANTVLDAQGTDRVLYLDNYAGGDITVDGFTIQNGVSTVDGSGIYARSQGSVLAGDVTLTNNIIRDNISEESGGGAYTRSYSENGTAGNIFLLNNTVSGNSSNLAGGVFASSYSVNGFAGSIALINNTIYENSASDYGGGTYASAGSSSNPGGVINFYNNIIWGNSAASSGDDIYIYNFSGDTTYSYHNNYSDMSGTWDNESGETDIDPQFIDPDNGDFRLRSSSPCIDAGETNLPSPPGLPSTDFEGDPRIIDATIDMGADEVSVVTICASVSGETTLQDALDDAEANGKGDVIMVQQGSYTGNFSFNSSEGHNITLLGGYASGWTSRVINPTNTILDAEGSGRVLELNNTAGGDVFLEGFTIQNGMGAANGLGLFASSMISSGTAGNVIIQANIIKNNTTTTSSNAGGMVAQSHIISSGTAGDVTLTGNLITGNTGTGYGGGAYVYSNSSSGSAGSITLTNNTISENTTTGNEGGGLFIYISSNGIVDAYNNIIWGNTAAVEGEDVYFVKGSGTIASSYNNAAGEDKVDGAVWDYSDDSNINIDPRLSGSYHLRHGSPCIDTGNNSPPGGLPASDIDGDDRTIDGDRDDTATVDMGADEYIPKGLLSFIMLLLN
ncbi:MAG: DUF5123 domain-containing protein [Deltaproteobacteria bacterium]|nr:DUF5123 domain-containing protein [Deltaproteobacteria bacterium]